MNVFEKLIDLLVAVFIMLLFPIIYLNQKSNLLAFQAMVDQTTSFIEDVSKLGKLSKERYDQFYQELHTSGKAFRIELSYEEIYYEPEYQKNKETEIFEFTKHVYRYPVTTQHEEILEILYDNDSDFCMNRGGYFQVIINLLDDKQKVITYGGAIR